MQFSFGNYLFNTRANVFAMTISFSPTKQLYFIYITQKSNPYPPTTKEVQARRDYLFKNCTNSKIKATIIIELVLKCNHCERTYIADKFH